MISGMPRSVDQSVAMKPKGSFMKNREGLFIREFTNGWAVYNRSGTAQEIEFSEEVSGWDSGVVHQRRHTFVRFGRCDLFEGGIGVGNPSYGGCQW